MNIRGKMDATVIILDGKPAGQHAFLSIDGCTIAHVFAGPFFGPDDLLRELALENAERLAAGWNGQATKP